QAIIRRYLSVAHANSPGTGCVRAALGPELARKPVAVRKRIEALLDGYRERLLPFVPGQTREEKHAKLKLLFPSMAGVLMMASVAIPKTAAVLVIETPRHGVTPQQIMAVIPEEIRATVRLYLDGKIREWYSRGDGKGVVFLVDAKTEDEARAIMETLPLAKEQLMDHQYIPVGPLMPLRALVGPGAQRYSCRRNFLTAGRPIRVLRS